MDAKTSLLMTRLIVALIGVAIGWVGVRWIDKALTEIKVLPKISYRRHWGGLGSGQGGWEVTGQATAGIWRGLMGVVFLAIGVGVAWPATTGLTRYPDSSDTGKDNKSGAQSSTTSEGTTSEGTTSEGTTSEGTASSGTS